jgi:2-polyprenyl-3-methyl-5-hydroxy-6-metoxy-1,4-benzoquinol methylase
VHGARLFGRGEEPFDKIIPFEQLKGRDVLEIGCGMGLHAELLSRAGAKLTTIDISDTSVEATKRRMMDARNLKLGDGSFDFVWSWGVIHHAAETARIIRTYLKIA